MTKDTQRGKFFDAYRAIAGLDEPMKDAAAARALRLRLWKSKGTRLAVAKIIGDDQQARRRLEALQRAPAPKVTVGRGVHADKWGIQFTNSITRRDVCWATAVAIGDWAWPDEPTHGWQFCAIMLVVMRRAIGTKASQALKAAYKQNGVRFRPKRKVSDEQRAAAAARFARMRLTMGESVYAERDAVVYDPIR